MPSEPVAQPGSITEAVWPGSCQIADGPWRKETLQSSCVYQRWMIRVRELSRTEHGTELATKCKKNDSASHQ
jgi:hypothetical protein